MKKEHEPYFYITSLGILTYIWTIFFGFTYFDDQSLILENLKFLQNLGNIPKAFGMDVFHTFIGGAYYRPILTVSFMIDSVVSGKDPLFYHLMNIVFHIIASCLIFIFLRKLKIKKDLALLFSIIFTVHPVLSQAVAWIPGRNDSLLTIFTLLSFIFFINFLKTRKIKDLIFHFIFLGIALFTKEVGLFIPFVIVLYVFLFRKKYMKLNKIYVVFFWVAIFAFWFLLRHFALLNPISFDPKEIFTSLYKELPAVILYFGKVFFPFNLSPLPVLRDSSLLYGIISIVLISVCLTLTKKKNYKLILFGTAWFLIFLFPSLINLNANYVADFMEHRIYLPIIGLFMVIGEIDFIKNINFLNKNTVKLVGFIIAFLIFVNFIHTAIFRDRLTFWQSAVASSYHHPFAHKNLGAMYYLDGNLAKAEKEFKISLSLNQLEPMVHNNLGLIYMDAGNFKMAEEEFQKEIQINSTFATAYYNYGLLLSKKGDTNKATEMFKKVLHFDPNYQL